jgi:iron(III) transport system ATP-binding protein
MRSLEFLHDFKAIYDRDKESLAPNVVYEVELASQERVLVYSPTDVAILGETVGLLITHLPESRQ